MARLNNERWRDTVTCVIAWPEERSLSCVPGLSPRPFSQATGDQLTKKASRPGWRWTALSAPAISGVRGEIRVPKQQRSEGLGGYAAVAIVALLIGRCSASDDGPVHSAAAVAPVSQPFTEASEDFASPAHPERGETTAEPEMSVGASGASATDSAAFAGAAIDPEGEEPTDIYYRNCSAARAAGAAPIHVGEPGYASHLDRDDDGVACE